MATQVASRPKTEHYGKQMVQDWQRIREEMIDWQSGDPIEFTEITNRLLGIAQEIERQSRLREIEKENKRTRKVLEVDEWEVDECLRFVREAEDNYPSKKRDISLRWLDDRYNKLEAVLKWTLDKKQKAGLVEKGLDIAGSLSIFWFFTDRYDEGLYWLERVISDPRAQEHSVARAKALSGAGLLYRAKGMITEAYDYLAKSARIFQEAVQVENRTDNWERLEWYYAFVLTILGLTERDISNQTGDAYEHITEGLERLRKQGSRWGEALAHYYLGMVHIRAALDASKDEELKERVAEQLDKAKQKLELALSMFRDLEDQWGIAQSLTYLGVAIHQMALSEESNSDINKSRSHEALEIYLKYLALMRRARKSRTGGVRSIDSKRGIARCLCGVASLVNREGKNSVALTLLGAAEAVRDELHAKLIHNDILDYMNVFKDAFTQARKQLDARDVYREGKHLSVDKAIDFALLSLLPVERIKLPDYNDAIVKAPCMYCGGRTKNSTASQRYWSVNAIYEADIPVYKCEDCGLKNLDSRAYTEFLSTVLHNIESMEEPSVVEALHLEVNIAKKHSQQIELLSKK